MSLVLNHYVHCPFCVRVRMALGYLQIPYDSKVLAYDDELTPVRLTGKKMLPILGHDKGAMNESLDIISFLDQQNVLKVKEFVSREDFTPFEQLLNSLGSPIHSLAMPHWIYTPEFTVSSREYFQKKKEEKRGPFKELVKNRHQFEAQLESLLAQVEGRLVPYYESENFNIKDILLASHLWGLYVVPEFQFSPRLHSYLQDVKKKCHFDYHRDFWS